MIDIRKRIKEVLEQGYLLSLGTVDGAGVWVADVIYIADNDLNLYWMSDPKFRHSQAIAKNQNVAGTITASQKPSDKDFAIQLEGKAEQLDGLQFALVAKYLLKQGKPEPKKVINILREGYSWYKLSHTKIELIDQKNFGFEKQRLTKNTT